MKIQISKATFERMEELGKSLTDDVILKAIELLMQEDQEVDIKPPPPIKDMFIRLQFTSPTKESTINGNPVTDLIYKRYGTTRTTWKGILGEVVGMSARGINDTDRISEIFGLYFRNERNDERLYIEELSATSWSPRAPDAGRAIAKGSKSLAYSVFVKFKRLPRNIDYKTLGADGEFKVNINGKGCEIS